jgi:hypothetical protein
MLMTATFFLLPFANNLDSYPDTVFNGRLIQRLSVETVFTDGNYRIWVLNFQPSFLPVICIVESHKKLKFSLLGDNRKFFLLHTENKGDILRDCVRISLNGKEPLQLIYCR